uniref:Uncharacterized protein n=1 Tax=Ananas comosus var. bracteatus TaxID=296719 RepID=A0A6V7Q560_ANACO|nr:unnamed protein product [Ananas comosus var. bracteatus]
MNQRTLQSAPPTIAFAGGHPSLANSSLLRAHNIRLLTLMPSPSLPPPNALDGRWPSKIIWRLERGAGRYWTFKVRYEVRTEAPPVEWRKVQAKRPRQEAAHEESRTIPNYYTDRQYAAEKAHADR